MRSIQVIAQSVLSFAFISILSAIASAQAAPAIPVGETSPVQTVTLKLASNATIGSINVLTKGALGRDFKYASGGTCGLGATYTAGETCTVK